jgi:hypothetical protein
MPFWSLRSGTTSPVAEGTAVPEAEATLELVELYLGGEPLPAMIDAEGQRMTDLLHGRLALQVRLTDGGEWVSVYADDILLAAPPPFVTRPDRRLHRVRRRITARVGPYLVSGIVHLQPGARLDLHMLQRRLRFLPLTTAVITRDDDPGFERLRPVAIVNLAHLRELREVVSPA